MKPKTMILAAVAVVCGLGAMWMTNRLLADKQQNAPEAEAKEKVLVAKTKIPSQTVFKDVSKYFEEKEIVTSAIPPKALRTSEKIQGKRLSRTLTEGGYVTTEDLVSPESDGLGAVLPAGMCAVAIRVQPDSMVAGFVLPKSHVDVMCTVRGNDGSTTYTILENVEVLAIDTKNTRGSEEAAAFVGSTVTLAASPDDCNLIKMAAGTGVLDLALRGIGDVTATKPQPVTQDILKNPARGRDAGETDPTLPQGIGRLPGNILPPLEKGPAATQPPAVEPKTEPELEVFVMTIVTGPNVERVRFTKKPGESWPTEASSWSGPETKPNQPAAETKPNEPAAETQPKQQPGAQPARRNPIGS